MKIALFGGTFNPVHTGHLILAQECVSQLDLDKFIFIPANIPPHKSVDGNTSGADRLQMVKLAISGADRFEVSDHEIAKQGVSYTIDTVRHFRGIFGDKNDYFFVTGADWAGSFDTWKDIEALKKLVRFVVLNRPGATIPESADIAAVTMPGVDISSTFIRKRVKSRLPIKYFTPAAVEEYIISKMLYR
jgi:nicotinate-nucleotide adenylyltransferase